MRFISAKVEGNRLIIRLHPDQRELRRMRDHGTSTIKATVPDCMSVTLTGDDLDVVVGGEEVGQVLKEQNLTRQRDLGDTLGKRVRTAAQQALC